MHLFMAVAQPVIILTGLWYHTRVVKRSLVKHRKQVNLIVMAMSKTPEKPDERTTGS